MKKTSITNTLSLTALLLALGTPVALKAAETSWKPDAGSNLWSTADNWSSGVPGASDTALLGETGSNRTVIFDTGASGARTISALQIEQASAFTNQLNVRSQLTATSGITLSASSGTSVLRLESNNSNENGFELFTSANASLLTGNITVGTGGHLQLSREIVSTSNTTNPRYVNGDITINGGTVTFYKYIRPSGLSGAYGYTVDGNLTMTSGKLEWAVTDSAYTGSGSHVSDTRVTVNGNFIVTGGTIAAPSGRIILNGEANTLSNYVIGSSGVYFDLQRNGDQTFSSTASLNSIEFRSNTDAIKTLTVTSSGDNVAGITIQQATAGKTTTLKLGGNISQKSGSSFGRGGSGTIAIDTAGYILNSSKATATFGSGSQWVLKDSVGGGKFILNAADLSGVDFTAKAGSTLESTTFTANNSTRLTLAITGASFGKIVATTQTYGGALIIDFDSTPSASSYQLFDFGSQSGEFTSVTLTGLYGLSLTNNNGIWSGTDTTSGYAFSFSQATGILSVTAPVPEPAMLALIGGIGVLSFVFLRRLRRNWSRHA